MKASASMIADANFCLMRPYLKKVMGEKPERLSVYEKGTLLHELVENFWNFLGTEEEVSKKRAKKKYSNADEFAKYAKGKWWQRVKIAEESKKSQPISWRSKEEKHIFGATIPKICFYLFPELIKRGKPLFSELTFSFVLGDIKFRGRIDEIRLEDGKVKIIDYKSGSPWMGEIKVETDPQLTLYNLAVCCFCYSNKRMAKALGLENRLMSDVKDPVYIDPEFEEQFFMIEAPYDIQKVESGLLKREMPKIILPTHRTEKHLFDLIAMTKTIQTIFDTGLIYPQRGSCDYCDVKYPCLRKLETQGRGFLADKKGNRFFSFAVPEFAREEEEPVPKIKLQSTLGLRRYRLKK